MFIITENGEILNSDQCSTPNITYFQYGDDDNRWGLWVKDENDEESLLILSDKSVQKVNQALISLRTAINHELGWDATEYIQGIDPLKALSLEQM